MIVGSGDWMFFGTDGISGETVSVVSDPQEAIRILQEERKITPRLMRLLGSALGLQYSGTAVIGWDNRPDNEALVTGLTQGLSISGMEVIHAGLCSTPALHNVLITSGSALGCMVTASHNPVSDSGVKIFDKDGYKAYPSEEIGISKKMVNLAAEDREVDDILLRESAIPSLEIDGLRLHSNLLRSRSVKLREWFGIPKGKILLDSSGGTASTWLSGLLNELGVHSEEVSLGVSALNEGCGAGDLSPTDSWSRENLPDDHALLSRLKEVYAEPGTLVGAALDGDGDRCLLIAATENGFKVIDGDAMGRLLCSHPDEEWFLAASIESDLILLEEFESVQTAVGDRWLSDAIRPKLDSGQLKVLGVEDSGHIVLPMEFECGWRLLGDGAATLIAILGAWKGFENESTGWKQRVSINGTDRNRWDGMNALSDEVEKAAKEWFESTGELSDWTRLSLDGEANLMLLQGRFNGTAFSLGVRNSGTQEKTNISLRFAGEEEGGKLIEKLEKLLGSKLIPAN